MRDESLRQLGSLLSVAILATAGYLYAQAPAAPRPAGAAASALVSRPSYHRPDAGSAVTPGSEGPCLGCHGTAPHRRRPGARAFLNLHAVRLECSACHLPSAGATYRRSGEGGQRVTPGRMTAGRWERLVWPEPGLALRPAGPRCTECHRRGSAILASGLYDDYRRRILEELSLLFRLGGSAL
ncbi:MAG: hypothetical protein HZB55_21550 [Deltaproteobacteria bacterium]|nr:hypothetical protein [Deltaproteobacteria bacterium]